MIPVEAVKERPVKRAGKSKSPLEGETKQAAKSSTEQKKQQSVSVAPVQEEITPKQFGDDSLGMEKPASESAPPSTLVQEDVGLIKPLSNPTEVSISPPVEENRVNHFLNYPVGINIRAKHWDQMRLFYEEVLELPLLQGLEQDQLAFVGKNFILTLIQDNSNSGGVGSLSGSVDIFFSSGISLARLAQKLAVRNVTAQEDTFGRHKIPFLYVLDPDGNRVLFTSNTNTEMKS